MIREGLEEAGCELRPENDEQAIRVAFQRETVVETQAWSGRGLSLPKGRVREWAGQASGGGHSERAGGRAGARALTQECSSSRDTAGLEGMEGRQ